MPKYYLVDENNNFVEGFDKEAFLALLQQAIADQSLENIDPDSAVASKLRSNLNGTTHHIEFVTQPQYNQLQASGQLVANTYYFITDDETAEGLAESIEKILNGDTAVGLAAFANGAQTDFTNAQTYGTAYGYHQDGYYGIIPADKVQGEGYYWLEFADDRNNTYNLGIVHRYGSTAENIISPMFICQDDGDHYQRCFIVAKEQNDGSVKVNVYYQSNSSADTINEFEADNCYVSVKKIR